MTHLQSAFAALSESNQQQQQQQQQQNSNFCQPMQTKPSGIFNHQQTNQYQQQPYNNPYLPQNQMPNMMPYPTYGQTMQQQQQQQQQPMPSPSFCLPPNLLDQLRALTTNTTPIFILPPNIPSSNNSSCINPCYSPTCIPYPMPLPIYQNFGGKSESSECKCYASSSSSSSSSKKSHSSSADNSSFNHTGITWNAEQHICKEGNDGQVCSKKNCPASIQLQAMISQLLAYQGIIPSVITRILLKRVPGSNVAESVDEIMEKAMRCIRQLAKDGLLRESCNSREVTKLLGLYLTSSSTLPRIIPVLTYVQLKCNVLKALVENLVSARLLDEQNNRGVEADEPLDRLLLELKPEDELRRTLAALRERECEERVNASFASCATQRRIAEARLASVQKKIRQVEAEMERRRDAYAGRCSGSERDEAAFNNRQLMSLVCGEKTSSNKHFDSPDPFEGICMTSPRKLFLKPHVGSPETTYEKPSASDEDLCETVKSVVEIVCDDGLKNDDVCKDAETEAKIED